MRTVASLIGERIEELRTLLRQFLVEHSGDLRDVNESPGELYFVGPSYAWPDLDQEGRRIQSRLIEDNSRLAALVRALLKAMPDDSTAALDESQTTLVEIIDQSRLVWFRTRDEALAKVDGALNKQLELIAALYDGSSGIAVYVPDTNALLWNPDLDAWRFDAAKTFTLILTATVLAELDRLKIEHRNPDVRAKAEGLIRRIKSYRGRGELARGVPLRRDISTIRTMAVEPKVREALPWLDPANDDDRIIAAMIEVMRNHSRSAVILVTRDINLQNKAEYAGVPFVEPPDPPTSATPATP